MILAKDEPNPWRDRVALVTGGSSGIGRGVVAALARRGMRVATAARRLDRLDALRAELGEAGERVMPVQTDLRAEADIMALFDAIRARWGGVEVLVNNAGLGHHAPLVSGATEHWREMLEVNVLALCVCTREAIADMRRASAPDASPDPSHDRPAGQIIHISSMAAYRVPPGSGMYSATKFAVRSLTEGLRQELRELGSPIRVTAISPGFVETGFAVHYHKSEDAAQKTYGRYPVLQPVDVASAVLYVLEQPGHVEIHDILLRPTEQPN